MGGHRLLKVFLAGAAIVVAGVWLALFLRARPSPPAAPPEPSESPAAAQVREFSFSDFVGGALRLFAKAGKGRVNPDGSFELQDLRELKIPRSKGSPLLLTAPRAMGAGAEGKRRIRLDGGVEVRDEDAAMTVRIPSVEIDQVAGIANSIGEVRLQSPKFSGSADRVVYGLEGQPTELSGVRIEAEPRAVVTASRGFLYRESREIELRGNVHGVQDGSILDADRVLLFRDADGALERAESSGEVRGAAASQSSGAEPLRFGARSAWAHATSGGPFDRVRLVGEAWLSEGASRLGAERIEASRSASGDAMEAEGGVRLEGVFRGAPGKLQADRVEAATDPSGRLTRGEARGSVRFESAGAPGSSPASGEAARATYDAASPSAVAVVSLFAEGDERARLASGRTRVAAERIDTSPDGATLHAAGKVESTLLPAPEATTGGETGMFSTTEAIHFVSATLDGGDSGRRLAFDGAVRGWQIDRSLFADHVEIDDVRKSLHAAGSVATRMPRGGVRAASEADYVQVGADSLDYDGTRGLAISTGSVRVRQADGWIESSRLEVDVATTGGGIRQSRASGSVKFESRTAAKDGSPRTASGTGDRMIYDPVAKTLRLFGDRSPAQVQRSGANGGTTTGRALLYHLDDGRIEVESGDRNRAKIKTSR